MRYLPLLVALAATPAFAAAPNFTLPAQGRILNGDDLPVEGALAVTYALFTGPVHLENDAALWSESYDVTALHGVYTLVLGAGEGKKALPATVFSDHDAVYLEVSIGGVRLNPRMRVGTMPLAANALGLTCQGCVSKDELAFDPDLVQPNAVGTPQLQDGAVTSAKLAAQLDGAKLADGTVPARALAGGITSAQLAGGITSAQLAGGITSAQLAGGITQDQLAGSIPAAKVAGLTSVQATCPGGQVLTGYTTSFAPVCVATDTFATRLPALLQWSLGVLDFGTTRVDVQKTATLTNLGSATAASLSIGATGGYTQTNGCGGSLAAGASCTVTFTLIAATGNGLRGGGGTASATGTSAVLLFTGNTVGAPGSDASSAAASCAAIKAASASATDGVYWIDPDGAGTGVPAAQMFCDMTSSGGGWTLVASTRIPWNGTTPGYDTVWSVAGGAYFDLQTTRAANSSVQLFNKIPFANLTDFRFTCLTSSNALSYGIDWVFPISQGANRANLGDLYDDAKMTTYGAVPLTQSTGTVRSAGYDSATSKADWGLGSSGADAVYWAHEAWGQVDQWGGHCQDPGTGHTTATLNGTGIFHIWVR